MLVREGTARSVHIGLTAPYHIRLCSGADNAGTLNAAGPAGSAYWEVVYIVNATAADITAAVTGAGWQTPELPRNGYAWVKILVTPGPSVPAGAQLSLALTGTSALDATKKDTVKAVTTRN